MKFKTAFAVIAFTAMSFAGSMSDAQGNTYPTVVIGSQEWMAENMKADVQGSSENWVIGQREDLSGPETFGRFYTWDAAKKVCPAGWHLPTAKDFETLLKNVGPDAVSRGITLRSPSIDDWNSNPGTDLYDFNARSSSGEVNGKDCGLSLNLWSKDKGKVLFVDEDGAKVKTFEVKGAKYSVRCVKD